MIWTGLLLIGLNLVVIFGKTSSLMIFSGKRFFEFVHQLFLVFSYSFSFEGIGSIFDILFWLVLNWLISS